MSAFRFIDSAAILGLLALLPAPGAMFAIGRGRRSIVNWIDAIAFGYAVSLLAVYCIALKDYRLFVPCWAVATVISAVWLWRRASDAGESNEPHAGRWFIFLLLIPFLIRVAPAVYAAFPLGWDPYFHLVVASRIQDAGKLIHDLHPLENFPLNYPLGSHVLVALISDFSQAPVHRVFSLALAWFETLCIAQAFALAWRLTLDRELSLYATGAYGLLAVMGSLGYYQWGGLPNLIGVYLFLGLLSRIARADKELIRETLVFAAFFLSICVVHHHAMISVAIVLASIALWQFLRSSDRRAAGLIVRGAIASAILGAAYFLPYLSRISSLGTTGIPDFFEGVSIIRDLNDLGLAFAFTAAMGLLVAFCLRKRQSTPDVLWVPVAVLLFCFAALKYGVGGVVLLTTGRRLSLFTPSRFLTDAVPLLAIFAAMFLIEMRRLLGVSQRSTMAAIAVCACLNLPFYTTLFRLEIPVTYQSAYAWLRKNSSPGAGILEMPIHGAYMTGRVASEMPLPISEYNPPDSNKRRLKAITEGKLPASAFGELYAIEEHGEFGALSGPVVWSDASGMRIRRLH